MTDLGTIRRKAKIWSGLTINFSDEIDRRIWIVRKTLLACIMALLVVAPMAWWLMPDRVLQLLGMTVAATMIVTPIASNHLIMHVVRLLQEQKELIHRANHDGMTGLMNRTYFFAQVQQLQTVQILRDQTFGIVAIDIDHFKAINDQFGHAVGDQVIIAFAELMQDLAPDDALVGRTGGEEFAVAIPGGIDRIECFVDTLRKNLAGLNIADTGVTVSAGIVIGQREDYIDLCVRADAALYEAKHAGRNCYRVAA